jgi:CubicO group peptidase (beta-lactamase class C family)
MRLIVALAVSLMLAALAPGVAPLAAPAGCDAPEAMADGWAVAAPQKDGLDARLICAIGPTLDKVRDADANGVVVVRHGVLVYEHYFVAGIEYGPDTLHDVRSITKSIVAILTGIAFDRGWLKSLDAPVFSFFPEHADLRSPENDRITLQDLLTMTSGLAWPELAVPYQDPANVERQMMADAHPYRFVLAQPLAATPGSVWNYNSGGVELLGAVLQKVSRQPIDRFAKEALFEPLGIGNWQWGQMPNGRFSASGGLWLRPRDLAKIGQLVLNHGVWHGRRIVSAAWIKAMTERQVVPGWPINSQGLYSYGYLWFLARSSIDNRNIGRVVAIGFGGQRLYVVPSEDLVVVGSAGHYRGKNSEQGVAGEMALDLALRAAAVR